MATCTALQPSSLCLAVVVGVMCCGYVVTAQSDFYSIDVVDAEGKTVSLENYRGKVVLVVNVASECGFTDGHYRALVKLQANFAHTDIFQILAFPCNQFGAQEPKGIKDILEFARDTYNVNFPIFSKVNTVQDNVADIFKFLKDQTGYDITWNFWKFLVNHDGKVAGFWGPWSSVEDIFPQIKGAVDEAIQVREKEIVTNNIKSKKQDKSQAESNTADISENTSEKKTQDSLPDAPPEGPMWHEDL